MLCVVSSFCGLVDGLERFGSRQHIGMVERIVGCSSVDRTARSVQAAVDRLARATCASNLIPASDVTCFRESAARASGTGILG